MSDDLKTIQPNVIHHIGVERKYQKIKWGNNPHTVGEWLLILQSELDEAKQGWVKNGGDRRALEEIVQVAAVAVAILEEHGIYHQQSHIDRILEWNHEQRNDGGLPL